MSARTNILGRLHQSTRKTKTTDVMDRDLQRHQRGPAPALRADLTTLFCERATGLGSDVIRVSVDADLPNMIKKYLESREAPTHAVIWRELVLLPWAAAGVTVETRNACGQDKVGMTGVFAGIAETGTLALLSSANTPATVSLLPETHIAIVPVERIVAAMEDVWILLRAQGGGMPRSVNFISGPSRTADVEQTVTLGAHGPRRVLIIVVG